MHYLKETSLIIDGATSSGGTITSLILAYYLSKKFIYAGGIYKYIASELGFDVKHGGLLDYEKIYGEKWDILWEKYIEWKIGKTPNLVVNSKLAGFMVDSKPWLFKVFLTADAEVRSHRAGTDKRTERIHERDAELTQRWAKLFKVKFMDFTDIRTTHDLLLDNSNLTIAQTVITIFNAMKRALSLNEQITLTEIEKVEVIAHSKGKEFFYERLETKGLLITNQEIFDDWIKYFEKDLKQMPKEWQEVVYS